MVTIVKARLTGTMLQRFFGVKPSYDIQEKYVRIYWKPEDLPTARNTFYNLVESGDDSIRVDFLPIVRPYVMRKYGIYIIGAAAALFLLGRL
jgi:hypothetical protein